MVAGISRLENYKTELIALPFNSGHIKYRTKRNVKVIRNLRTWSENLTILKLYKNKIKYYTFDLIINLFGGLELITFGKVQLPCIHLRILHLCFIRKPYKSNLLFAQRNQGAIPENILCYNNKIVNEKELNAQGSIKMWLLPLCDVKVMEWYQ